MNDNVYTLNIPTKVYFTHTLEETLFEHLRENQYKNITLVIDHNLRQVALVDSLVKSLAQAFDCEVGWCTEAEPCYTYLDDFRLNFKKKDTDAVIGIGGGSTLDAAKAISVLMTNLEPAITYRGFNQFKTPIPPVIAIPTTAGTGSEVTPNASFVDAIQKKKMGINGEAIRPIAAFMAPALTLSCPRSATISAAIDSTVHSIEAFTAKKATPIARFFAKKGFWEVANTLHALIQDPDNLSYREQVMRGAFFSGIALMHSGTGPASAISYPLGVHSKIPHGYAGGLALPHVIEYNISQGVFDYAHFMTEQPESKSQRQELSFEFLHTIKTLWENVELYNVLTRHEIDESLESLFIQDVLDLAPALEQNPVPFGPAEISLIFKKINEQKLSQVCLR